MKQLNQKEILQLIDNYEINAELNYRFSDISFSSDIEPLIDS